MKPKRSLARSASNHVPGSPQISRLSIQFRLLIYVAVAIFALAGLEMLVLTFSGNHQTVAANGLQPGVQSAAIATAPALVLDTAAGTLPNSKQDAANYTKLHQSAFDFNQSAAAIKAAGYSLKDNLLLVPAGSGLRNQNKVEPALLPSVFKAAAPAQSRYAAQAQAVTTTVAADAFEPDNSPQQAKAINVTIAPDLSGTQGHTFTNVNDVDWVYFVVRKPGINYTIFTNATNASGVDTRLDLYDANLNLVATNDDSPSLIGDNPRNSAINFVPADTGGSAVYYVRVSDVAVDGSAGAYFLTAYESSTVGNITPPSTFTPGTPPTTAPACADAYDPSGSPNQAKELDPSLTSLSAFGTTGFPPVDATNDGTQTHLICPAGEIDWAYFDLVAGKPYSIFTSSLKGGVDTFMVLYNVDSRGNITPLYSNDDFAGMGLASRIDWVVPATITTPLGSFVRYYLAVKDVAGHGGPSLGYNLTLATVGNQTGDCNDYYQPDYGPTQAKNIQINETQTHTFCPAGNSHWIRFFAKGNGRTYVMQTLFVKGTPGLDTSVVIYAVQFDPANPTNVLSATPLSTQKIVPNSDPNDLSSTVTFSVPADGYYYAQIRNAGDLGQPGLTYQLRFAVSAAGAGDFSSTQTAVANQTASSQGSGSTATAQAINDNRTATAIALTVFAVNGTQTAALQTATAQGTPNPSQQTAAAQGTPTPTRTSGAASQLVPPAALSNAFFADPNFNNVWSRVDKAIVDGLVNRSWEYGPKPGPMKIEPYAEASGGTRQVQYFSKSRMEINNPKGDRSSPWFVTNGLLVKEMISGSVAMGDNKFVPTNPPNLPVAGDLSSTNDAPTYASFNKIITINNSNRATDQTNQVVSQSLSRDGKVSTLTTVPEQVKLAAYIPETGHNVADKFWTYLNSQGLVYQNGQYQNGQLMDWVFVMGLPISEPYWVKAQVGGIEHDVLVQVFERRILTYTPSNPTGWQVEMGNVGEHYYLWRYGVSLYATN